MTFVESESGLLINTDQIRTIKPYAGGYWTVQWADGREQNFTSTDGKAVKAAVIKAKPGRKPKHTVE
jgi:hypothetical protein